RINDTVESIKQQIQKLKSIPVNSQRLFYLTRELCNEGTLEDYGFQKEGVMFLSLYMNILVVMLDGKTISFRVSECDTVKSVKQKIQDREGIPVHEQRLVYTAQGLVDNEKKLADYNVQDGGLMYLSLRLFGGC
ncbi:15331_t:CDS:2, partial [Cetraspora pellucida]